MYIQVCNSHIRRLDGAEILVYYGIHYVLVKQFLFTFAAKN